MTRQITAHKGGRTERISARITPEDKAALEKLTDNISDWITEQVRKETEIMYVETHVYHGKETDSFSTDWVCRIDTDPTTIDHANEFRFPTRREAQRFANYINDAAKNASGASELYREISRYFA